MKINYTSDIYYIFIINYTSDIYYLFIINELPQDNSEINYMNKFN